MKTRYLVVIGCFVLTLAGGLVWSANHYHSKYQSEKLRADTAVKEVESQGEVIASQTFNFNRFNQAAEYTGNLNSLIGAGSERTVIEYREILHSEKTCDMPVPADVAGGLLNYANRLRASAMHTDTGNIDAASDSTTTTGALTYCQAVLWINPLLAVIEQANNQLIGIRQIERDRQ
jgi:hypothetical protein